jgi:hypothetical protein
MRHANKRDRGCYSQDGQLKTRQQPRYWSFLTVVGAKIQTFDYAALDGVCSALLVGWSPDSTVIGGRAESRCRDITNGMVRRLNPPAAGGIRAEQRCPMELHTIGIDLGKTVSPLGGLNHRGEGVGARSFRASNCCPSREPEKVELIGMEACGGAHF